MQPLLFFVPVVVKHGYQIVRMGGLVSMKSAVVAVGIGGHSTIEGITEYHNPIFIAVCHITCVFLTVQVSFTCSA